MSNRLISYFDLTLENKTFKLRKHLYLFAQIFIKITCVTIFHQLSKVEIATKQICTYNNNKFQISQGKIESYHFLHMCFFKNLASAVGIRPTYMCSSQFYTIYNYSRNSTKYCFNFSSCNSLQL